MEEKMNGYNVNTHNLTELAGIGNSNQSIGEVEPQGTITTIPLTVIATLQLCIPVTVLTVTMKNKCF